LLIVRRRRPLLLLVGRRNRLVRTRLLIAGRNRPVLLRIVSASGLLVVGPAMIRLVHLRRIAAILLLLIVRRHRTARWLRRLLTIILLTIVLIRWRLVQVRAIAGALLLDSALISGHGSRGVSTGNAERRLILPVVGPLLLISLRSRELVLLAAPIRCWMSRRCNDCTSGQGSLRRCLSNWRCLRYRSRFCSDLLPTLVDQHRPFNPYWNSRNRTGDDGTLRGCHRGLRHGPELLHLPRINAHCNVAHSAA
jgi:hypothetical protein